MSSFSAASGSGAPEGRSARERGDDGADASQPPAKRPRLLTPRIASDHPFEAMPEDAAETPLEAYLDVAPFLDAVATALGKTRATLVVYDPFYCEGSMKTHLAALGFTRVINENRDFYADIAAGTVPPHDVLLTNPPFSGSHMPRLLAFAAAQKGVGAGSSSSSPPPFAFLMPAFVARKGYWLEYCKTASCKPLYLGPGAAPYAFTAPRLAADGVTPFVPHREKDAGRDEEETAEEDIEDANVRAGSFQCIWFLQPRTDGLRKAVEQAFADAAASAVTGSSKEEEAAGASAAETRPSPVLAHAADALPQLAPAGRRPTPAERRWRKKVREAAAAGRPLPQLSTAPAPGRQGGRAGGRGGGGRSERRGGGAGAGGGHQRR